MKAKLLLNHADLKRMEIFRKPIRTRWWSRWSTLKRKRWSNSTIRAAKKLPTEFIRQQTPSERYNLDLPGKCQLWWLQRNAAIPQCGDPVFQTHLMLDATSYSTIPAGLNRLEFEIEKIGYHQMHSLWTAWEQNISPLWFIKWDSSPFRAMNWCICTAISQVTTEAISWYKAAIQWHSVSSISYLLRKWYLLHVCNSIPVRQLAALLQKIRF